MDFYTWRMISRLKSTANTSLLLVSSTQSLRPPTLNSHQPMSSERECTSLKLRHTSRVGSCQLQATRPRHFATFLSDRAATNARDGHALWVVAAQVHD